MRPRPTLALALALVGGAALTGCATGPVEVQPPEPQPSGAAAKACTRLARALPDRLDGEPRRDTEPASPFTAAWGDPAVVVRCGVDDPVGLTPTSQLFSVNRVDWFPVEEDDGSATFTTTGRVVNVEVLVPESQQPGANYLVDLAGSVTRHVPEDEG